MDTPSLRETLAHLPLFSKVSRFSKFLEFVIRYCLYACIALVPLWFMSGSVESLELHKQTFLIVFVMVALIAWLAKAIYEKHFHLKKSWLHIVVAMFAICYFFVSLFSQDTYTSLVGNFGQMQWAFISIAAFVLFYTLIVNTITTTTRLYDVLLVFVGFSFIVGGYALLQLFGVYPLAWLSAATAQNSFNTVGSFNSLAVYMAIPLMLCASLTVLGCKDVGCILGRGTKRSTAAKGLVWAVLALSALVLVIVNYWVAWALVLVGTILLVGITYVRTKKIGHPTSVIVPSALGVLSLCLLFWNPPFHITVPGEVLPSPSHSWDIARQTIQAHPFFGSGPGTWIYDYAKYRSAAANVTPYWQMRFDKGHDSFLSLIAMLGIVGTSLWLIVIGSGIGKSVHHLLQEKDDDMWQAYVTVFIGWILTVVTAFLYNYTFSQHFVFWFLLALLAALLSKGEIRVDGKKSVFATTALSIILVIVSVCVFSFGWLAGQRLVADTKYTSSLMKYASGKDITVSIESLKQAISLNPYNDAYYRMLAQAYLIQLTNELQAKPTQDKTPLINSLVTDAVSTAKKATDILSVNVDNWSQLAQIYQAIASFTRGADELAIKSYQDALEREPNNPTFYNEIGKLYVLRADAFHTLMSSNDAKTKKAAEADMKAELDKAAVALNQSIQIKPDFAQAHYSLGIVYERQGRIKDAITKLEQVLAANNKDVGMAFQLAVLYYRDGQKDRALNLLEQIVAFDASYANARWYLASLYEERNRIEDAIAQILEIQKVNPDNQLITQRLEALRKIRDSHKTVVTPSKQALPEPVKESITGPKGIHESLKI